MAEKDIFKVIKRKTIKLQPGRYTVTLHYDSSNIDLVSNLNGNLEIGDIPSPGNKRFRAKLMVLNYPEKRVKVTCKEKISIANLIQGGEI